MGLKKIARPMNKAKNEFVKWLNKQGVKKINYYSPDLNSDNLNDTKFDYYIHVSAFIGRTLVGAYFIVWDGKDKVDFYDGDNTYDGMSIEEFLNAIQ